MFRYDGPIFQLISRATDLVILGVIWVVMCIPVFTIGAATTAAYYVAFNQLNDKDGYVLSKFFKSFKLNFVQSTMLFLITFVMIYFAVFNLRLVNAGVVGDNGFLTVAVMVSQLCLIYEAMLFSFFGYSLLAKINFTNKDLIKTAFLLGNKHILTSVLNIIIVFAIAFAVAIMPVLIIFAGGAYFILSGTLMKRILLKYKPEAFDSVINDDASFKVATNAPQAFSEEDLVDNEEVD